MATSTSLTPRAAAEARFEMMRTEQSAWRSHWAELATYILPRRYRWLTTTTSARRGGEINTAIIDETATKAWEVLSAGMLAGICSRPVRGSNFVSLAKTTNRAQ